VRGATNGDGAAFDKVNARLAGFHVNIASAAQNGFHFTLHNFHAHRAFDGDGFAVNGSNHVAKRRIIMGCGTEKERSGVDESGGGNNR
jgi:hypothetical protein